MFAARRPSSPSGPASINSQPELSAFGSATFLIPGLFGMAKMAAACVDANDVAQLNFGDSKFRRETRWRSKGDLLMGSILNESDRAEILRRFDSLSASATGRWGTLDVVGMLQHL